MEITKVFRVLVVATLALSALESASIFLVESELPEAVDEYLLSEASPFVDFFESSTIGIQLLVGILALVVLVAFIASCFGMLKFRRWARVTFICVTVVGYALIPFIFGNSLSTPLERAIHSLHCMIDGAILVMLLLGPIKTNFAKPADTGTPPDP